MYQSVDAVAGLYPEAKDSITSTVLGVIIASIVYFFVSLMSEVVVLWTDVQQRRVMRATALRKQASGKKLGGADGGSRASRGGAAFDLSVPSGLAQGSIYEKHAGKKPRDAVESSFNPLMLQQSGAAGGLGLDAVSMNVADSVASMVGPPPPEVWRVFQGAFKDMHSTIIEGKIREAELLAQLHSSAASAAADPGLSRADSRADRSTFAPQTAGAAGAGAAGGQMGMMSAFRSSAAGSSSRNSSAR